MKKIFIGIFILLVLVVMLYLIYFVEKPKKRLECLAPGTKYKKILSCVGPRCSSIESCVTEYKDGGRTCNTGKDCESGKCEFNEKQLKFCIYEEFNCGEYHQYIDENNKLQKYDCIF